MRVRKQVESGGWWFITNRSNPGLPLFRDAEDYSQMISCLAEVHIRFRVQISGYVLLHDHFHAVLKSDNGELPRCMHWLNLCYGHRHRHRHGFQGHLFSSQYDAKPLAEEPGNLLQASYYLHLHPHRFALGIRGHHLPWLPPSPPADCGRIVQQAIAHGWNSLPDWLHPERRRDWIHPVQTDAPYSKLLEEALRSGLPQGIDSLRSQEPQPLPATTAQCNDDRLSAVIRRVETEVGEPWAQFRDKHGHPGRDRVICRAAREGLSTQTLARLLGMSPSAVSKALQRCRGKCPD